MFTCARVHVSQPSEAREEGAYVQFLIERSKQGRHIGEDGRAASQSAGRLSNWTTSRPADYPANPKVSRNPNFCVGCFELRISKSFAAASKMGKNGQKLNFSAIFFRGILRRALRQTKFCIVFCALGIGVDSFCCYCKRLYVPCCCYCKRLYVPWTLGLHPFLHGHINVDQLGSGIAVHSTDKYQQAWFRSTSFATNQFQTFP